MGDTSPDTGPNILVRAWALFLIHCRDGPKKLAGKVMFILNAEKISGFQWKTIKEKGPKSSKK